MAFTQGIKGSPVPARLLQGGYVSTGSATRIQSKHIHNVPARSLQGSYAVFGFSTYIQSIHCENVHISFSEKLVYLNPPTVFPFIDLHCQIQALPSVPGDDTSHISFGQYIEFDATPRYGFSPLAVQFTNKSTGAIKYFYWLFGDGRRSYHSDPSHLYTTGVYDVQLTIKVGIRTLTLRKRRYIKVLPGGLFVSRTTRCIRHAILPEHGVGFYEMPASAMPMPESGVGVLSVYDLNNQIRGLVLDARTGLWYDVTTRDGPTGTGLSRVWTGISGQQFDRKMKFKEDRGTDEKDFQRLIESHLYMRPISELNRNVSGYNSETGYPDGLEVDLNFYNDGEPTTPSASITDIPLNGDIKSDRKVEGNRVQMEVTTNRGAHIILNRLNIYDSSRRAASPEKRIMSEMDYQEELGNSVFWCDIFQSSIINRVNGASIAIASYSEIEGPVSGGATSGIQFSSPITPGSISISSGSVLFWLSGTAALTINGDAIALTDLGTSNGYTLKYAQGISKIGSVVLTPTGTAAIADFRVFGAALSTGSKNYYLGNVQNNNGDVVLP